MFCERSRSRAQRILLSSRTDLWFHGAKPEPTWSQCVFPCCVAARCWSLRVWFFFLLPNFLPRRSCWMVDSKTAHPMEYFLTPDFGLQRPREEAPRRSALRRRVVREMGFGATRETSVRNGGPPLIRRSAPTLERCLRRAHGSGRLQAN